MALDSKVVFKARLTALGLADYTQKFVDAGWDTIAKTYNVSANSPAGLEDCMQHSMNRTSAWRRPRSSEEEKQAAIAEWLESRH